MFWPLKRKGLPRLWQTCFLTGRSEREQMRRELGYADRWPGVESVLEPCICSWSEGVGRLAGFAFSFRCSLSFSLSLSLSISTLPLSFSSLLSGVKRAVKYVNEFLAPALCNQVIQCVCGNNEARGDESSLDSRRHECMGSV